MNLEIFWNRYVEQLRLRNYSPRTFITMETYFHRFREFLAEAGVTDLQAVTARTLEDFQRWLYHQPTHRQTPRTMRSQNRVLSTVKGWFDFLHRDGVLSHNPAKGLKSAKEPDALPKDVLTPAEARRIVEKPDLGTLLGYRDRTILEVLYATGIRKAELLNLRVEDANLEEELLRINQGKGGKDRVVPLSRVACRHLENYLKAVRPELVGHRRRFPKYVGRLAPELFGRLFLSIKGGPLGHHGIGRLVAKYAKLAKVKQRVTPHLWRHTCATHLLQNNANLRHVQEILGHRSLATTEKYLRLTITDLKAAHRKFHPRERRVEKDD